MNHKKNVLTIAGSDSSGGAGIQADIKTFEALNVYSSSIITSVTAQNTLGVQKIFDLPDDMISSQLDSVFADIHFSAVKIGMLKKQSYIDIVSRKLRDNSPIIIVLDPVMISTSGQRLLDENAIKSMTEKLFPLADLITPNIPEASALLEKDHTSIELDLKEACEQLINKFSLKAVLLKGGHLSGGICEDTLAFKDSFNKIQYCAFKYTKIPSMNTHGTGCTLASAITAFMAQGFPIDIAVKNAGKYLQDTLVSTDLLKVGHGKGPLNHRLD